VTHESNRRSGIGGEIVSQIVERGFDLFDAPPVVVAGGDVPMPYSRALEKLVIPNEQKIKEGVYLVLKD
jgi:pyruvate dehydrogenase E1 component beta subunit